MMEDCQIIGQFFTNLLVDWAEGVAIVSQTESRRLRGPGSRVKGSPPAEARPYSVIGPLVEGWDL